MLADGFLTAGILSLVMPLALLAIVLGAWWFAVRGGALKESAPQQRESGRGAYRPGG
jgi:hypothetical protein